LPRTSRGRRSPGYRPISREVRSRPARCHGWPEGGGHAPVRSAHLLYPPWTGGHGPRPRIHRRAGCPARPRRGDGPRRWTAGGRTPCADGTRLGSTRSARVVPGGRSRGSSVNGEGSMLLSPGSSGNLPGWKRGPGLGAALSPFEEGGGPASAVTADKRMPLRKWPAGDDCGLAFAVRAVCPGRRGTGPRMGAVVAGAGSVAPRWPRRRTRLADRGGTAVVASTEQVRGRRPRGDRPGRPRSSWVAPMGRGSPVPGAGRSRGRGPWDDRAGPCGVRICGMLAGVPEAGGSDPWTGRIALRTSSGTAVRGHGWRDRRR